MMFSSFTIAVVASLVGCGKLTESWTPLYRAVSPLRMVATTSAPNSPTDIVETTIHSPLLGRSGHDNEAWKATYTSCREEIPPTVLECKELPADFPIGTYYRNGHARFESDDGMRCQHMFDGDGMVTALTFDAKRGRILFRNRYVRTAGFVRDQATKTMSMPGTFGTRVSGGWTKNIFRTDFKNIANTHVLFSQEPALYALWEAGWPYKLDPLTLENDVSKEPNGNDLKGMLKNGESFAAHYRYDAVAGNYVNFAAKLNPAEGSTKICLFEFDASMNFVRDDEVSFVFDGTGITHDYALTQSWHVFSIPPATMNTKNAVQALLGLKAFASVVDFQGNHNETLLVLVPRLNVLEPNSAAMMNMWTDDRIKVIKVPYHFSFHCANAFDDVNGNVVVDLVLMNEAVLGTEFPRDRPVWESADWDQDVSQPNYVRLTVDPIRKVMVDAPLVVTRRAPEFPSVPRALSTLRHRYAYSVGAHQEFAMNPVTQRGSGPPGAILKVDTQEPANTEAYAFLPHEFPGEPNFVPKIGADITQIEDQGYLVSLVVNGIDLTTDLVIFNVEGRGSLASGPVARMRLPTYIPQGLHGTFVEGLTFDF